MANSAQNSGAALNKIGVFGIAPIEAVSPTIVHLALMPDHSTQQETRMPQNTKDSKGGKNKPVRDTGANGGKRTDKGSADGETASPAGSQKKGEKKTTP